MHPDDGPLAHPAPRSTGSRVVFRLVPPLVKAVLHSVGRLEVELLDRDRWNCAAALHRRAHRQLRVSALTGLRRKGCTLEKSSRAGGKTVYRITEAIRIEGKIQKPEAFYVLQKSSINYDWQDLKQDFVPKIFESVTQAPF